MAIVVTELHDSREIWTDSDGTKRMIRRYKVEGTDDPYIAEAYGPPHGGGFGGDLFVKQKHAWRVPAADQVTCKLDVDYSSKLPSGGIGPNFQPIEELEISATTVHIERALRQRHYPGAEDVGDLIGADQDQIQGTEKYVPQGTYRYTTFYLSFPRSAWQPLIRYVGQVNKYGWKGFQSGELLFAGMGVRKNAANYYEVSFRFLFSPNVSFQIRSEKYGLLDVIKNGHEYFWVSKISKVSAVGGIDKKQYQALAGHVATIYQEFNCTVLGIGS